MFSLKQTKLSDSRQISLLYCKHENRPAKKKNHNNCTKSKYLVLIKPSLEKLMAILIISTVIEIDQFSRCLLKLKFKTHTNMKPIRNRYFWGKGARGKLYRVISFIQLRDRSEPAVRWTAFWIFIWRGPQLWMFRCVRDSPHRGCIKTVTLFKVHTIETPTAEDQAYINTSWLHILVSKNVEFRGSIKDSSCVRPQMRHD